MQELTGKPAVARGEAAFGHRLPDGMLGCDLCPRFCELKPGEKGWCQTRYSKNGRLWAANYNWLSLLQFSPVENVPLAEHAKGGAVLQLGSFGCNYVSPGGERERFGAQPGLGRSIKPIDILNICGNLAQHGCVGAAYTYAEPLLWYEFVMQCCMLLKQGDMQNILATAGFVNPRPLQELLPYLDAVRFDLFAFDPTYYRQEMRVGFDSVLKSLKILVESPVHVEVATPIIFGFNDDPQMIGTVAAYLGKTYSPEIPYHLLAPKRTLSPEQQEKMMSCADAAGRFLHRVYLS